jgi:hypothetical protein
MEAGYCRGPGCSTADDDTCRIENLYFLTCIRISEPGLRIVYNVGLRKKVSLRRQVLLRYMARILVSEKIRDYKAETYSVYYICK